MVHVAEFEEKTYEKYFGQELSSLVANAFSPGKMAEKELGFDEAFFIPWWLRGYRFRNIFSCWCHSWPGIILHDLSYLPEKNKLATPAKMRFNFFVQYKRPTFVAGHRAKEWSSWNEPYFRYDLLAHQHEALERLENASQNRATAIYSSAAFWKNSDLFTHATNGSVISESNFASVSQISFGHSRFTYVESGVHGIACSEPVEIESLSLRQLIGQVSEQEPLDMFDHILKLSKAIIISLENNLEASNNLQLAIEANSRVSEDERLVRGEFGEFVKAMILVESFCDIFNARLYLL